MRALAAPSFATASSSSSSSTSFVHSRARRAWTSRSSLAPVRVSSSLARSRRGERRLHRAPARAFLFWSQEQELRKRWKQFCDFAADEIPQTRFGGKKGDAAKLLRWIGEYPLTASGVAMAFAGGVSALVSAAVLPVVAGVMFLALPGLIFAFVGTAAFMFIAGSMVLVLALPALGFLSIAGGSIGAALTAKLLPLTLLGAGAVFAAKSIEGGIKGDERSRAVSGAEATNDDWSPKNVNRADDSDASEDEEDFEETVKRNFDERLRALDRKK